MARMQKTGERQLEKPFRLPPAPRDRYAELASSARTRTHALRQQLAKELAPALNARIKAMLHETLNDKKELARWVNDQLEPLGLAVQCPNTGLPAKLRGVVGNWLEVGRFAFQIYKDGKRKKTAY